jgi:SRSO17 transposase
MTPQQISGLGPALTEFLGSFKSCLGECRLRAHFATYCRGLLSGLQRKSVEPIALAAGSTVRALQLFLNRRSWDHARLRDQLQRRVATQLLPAPAPGCAPGCAPGITSGAVGPPGASDDLGVIGLIDETSVAKKGDKTPGVQRQYCGASGKIDNCIVTVHLGCGRGELAVLLDSDLYLPQSWVDDRTAGGSRCRDADIPDDMICRPKTVIALDLVRRAIGNGIRFDWQVFDEGYGKDPSFLLGLDALGQTWIGEVPKNFRCWPTLPWCHSLRKEFDRKEVYNVTRWSPAFIYQPWRCITHARQTLVPVVWEVKAAQVHLRDPITDRPTDRTYWLIVAWNPQTEECKYFLSNAPPHTDLELLLRVAFQRAQIEHLFRVAKQEVGLAHFEGRSYVGLMRHMILCQLILLFLAQETRRINRDLEVPAAPPQIPTADRGGKYTAPGNAPGPAPGNAAQTRRHSAPRDHRADRRFAPLALCPLA